MTVQHIDAPVHRAPPATVGELIDRLNRQPCEIGFVIGDCNSPENAPFLDDATGGQPCWPCCARRIRQVVPA